MFWHCWLVISLGNLAIKISCWQSPNISLRRILVTGLTHGNHRKKANLTRAQSISMWNVLIISCQPLTYWQCLVDSAWWRVDSDVSGTIQFHEPTGSLPLEFTPFRSLEDYWSKWVCTVCIWCRQWHAWSKYTNTIISVSNSYMTKAWSFISVRQNSYK